MPTTRRRTALTTSSSGEPSSSRAIRWATTSVSVSELKAMPRASNCALRAAAFSMMPLCTTA
ncbi:MAG: hypothetical protein U1E60_09170 [Reyranellaceae bacterium]